MELRAAVISGGGARGSKLGIWLLVALLLPIPGAHPTLVSVVIGRPIPQGTCAPVVVYSS